MRNDVIKVKISLSEAGTEPEIWFGKQSSNPIGMPKIYLQYKTNSDKIINTNRIMTKNSIQKFRSGLRFAFL